jgi:outer membrane protein OmpA-like peptidoglycan-associated protein
MQDVPSTKSKVSQPFQINELNTLKAKNASVDKDVDEQIIVVEKQLLEKDLSSEQQLCLLWKYNELLDLRSGTALPNPKYKKASAAREMVVVENASTSSKYTRDTVVVMNPMTNKRDTVIRVEKTVMAATTDTFAERMRYEVLRAELDRLRKDVRQYQDVVMRMHAADTMRYLPARKKGDNDAPSDEAIEIAIARLRKSITPTIIRDTITVERIVEKPVIQYVDKPVIQYVDKPVVTYVDKVIERPVEKVIEKTVTKVEQLLSLPPDVILFDVGKSAVKAQYNSRLTYYATQLKKFPELKVMLAGYTDNSGNAATNLKLSEARAANVRKFLMSKGVTENQIDTSFDGANNPAADNASTGSKSQNRRVEISFNK